MKNLPPLLLSLGAIICFCLTIFFCLYSEIKAALLMSGLFFLCILLAYFPQIESLRAFAIDVKLRKNLDRAEEILDRVRRLTIFNAKISYVVLAWQNRMGSPSAKSKQEMLDEIDQMLLGLNVEENERRKIVQPYIRLIGVDLSHIFSTVVEKYITWKKEQIMGGNSDELKAKREEFCQKEREWHQTRGKGITLDLDKDTLDGYLQKWIPENLFDEHEKEAINVFRQTIIKLFEESESKGGLTSDAAAFLDQRKDEKDGAQKIMQNVFKL